MWLARGSCSACGARIARRAPVPGRCIARCNLCQATTALRATRPREPLLAAAALLTLLGYAVTASGPAIDTPWATIEQTLVIDPSVRGSTLRVETRALDEAGRELAAPPPGVPPAWSFAAHAALVDPARLAWSTCADALACRFEAGNATFAYFTAFDPASALVNAYDTRTGATYLFLGEWSAWEDPQQAMRVTISFDGGTS